MREIKVIELFAGVGGFRLGLTQASKKYKVVWSNQWEPSTKTQHASEIYIKHFGPENHSNEDIEEVINNNFKEIPVHDLLVGGFPCQDYSVATTLKHAKGIKGKKGVLWWSIYEILRKMKDDRPNYLFLENVDRLLKSPATQRGRDFGVMLSSLSDLGYAVEWRVVNAADYGMPQRRRRVFILGYKKGTPLYDSIRKNEKELPRWLYEESIGVSAFPIEDEYSLSPDFEIKGLIPHVSSHFPDIKGPKSPFEISGVMIDRKISTMKVKPKYGGNGTTLGDIVRNTNEEEIPEEFFIKKEDMDKWETLKGPKSLDRVSKDGHRYKYSEGGMAFPDPLDKPSRTIVTGEGGRGPSRFKHVILTSGGRLRRLIPAELDQLDMFEADYTKYMLNEKETSDTRRAFIIGNALVVGVIERFGDTLIKKIEEY